MPGGRRNPLSMSHMLESLGDAVNNAKNKVENRRAELTRKMNELGIEVPWVDLQIQFIGASGLPKMDVVGSADPYFIAKIDDKISFVSTVKHNSLSPVWNEVWRMKNVPATADLYITVMDKDEGSVHDDYIGKLKTSVTPGTKEVEIEGPVFRRSRGDFWVKIDSEPATDAAPTEFPYLFNGPIRYSRHFSPTVGAFTNLDDARLYSTWKMYIMGVPIFFGDTYQHWNKNYKAAQNIFGSGPASLAVRSGIQAGHRLLYARTSGNGFGIIEDAAGIKAVLQGGERELVQAWEDAWGPGPSPEDDDAANPSVPAPRTRRGHRRGGSTASGGSGSSSKRPSALFADRVKPAVYTYIISAEDDSFRFSETGAAFFVDFASKHALHANCAETVRYSGEFHPRPEGGWENFNDTIRDEDVNWELVIDNNSGTYAPDKDILPALKKLLEYNFPGFAIYAMDHGEEELKKSTDACRQYALKYRGVQQDQLEPHAHDGEVTLSHQALVHLQNMETNSDSGAAAGSK
ncbi:unnamed protein product [Cyclocybe aegerita]|uniref:C2 domain-containing protein n=1 Tax=Cyclocybe aegerita TaxID=1973307 RepID=A0A8S0WML5_CYCAE|nr:unnamed protein product [Cyclocybe aegerita]